MKKEFSKKYRRKEVQVKKKLKMKLLMIKSQFVLYFYIISLIKNNKIKY